MCPGLARRQRHDMISSVPWNCHRRMEIWTYRLFNREDRALTDCLCLLSSMTVMKKSICENNEKSEWKQIAFLSASVSYTRIIMDICCWARRLCKWASWCSHLSIIRSIPMHRWTFLYSIRSFRCDENKSGAVVFTWISIHSLCKCSVTSASSAEFVH